MNKYSLDFDKKASKDLLSLDKSIRNFILDELEIFINNFDEDYEKELIKIKKIKSLQGEFKYSKVKYINFIFIFKEIYFWIYFIKD